MQYIEPGSTSQSLVMYLQDSVTGGAYVTEDQTDWTFSYIQEGEASATADATITAGTLGTWADGTSKPFGTTGLWQIDFADAAFAVGVKYVQLLVTHDNGDFIPKSVMIDLSVRQADAVEISGSSDAANNVESVFTATGIADDVDLQARSLTVTNDAGPGVAVTGTTHGTKIEATANGGTGLDVVASADNGTGVYISAQGDGTDEIGLKIDSPSVEFLFADQANLVSVTATHPIVGNITGNLSGTVGSVNARSDYMLRAGEAAQQSDITGSNLTVTSDITGGNLTVVSDITGGNIAVTSDTQNAILAAAGLDSISTTEPAGLASNYREKMIQVYRRFFGKTTMTSDTLLTYKEDESTPATTQTVTDDGTTQSQGEAS